MVFDRGNGINRGEGIATKLGFGVAVVLGAAAIGWGWNHGLMQERTYEQEAREALADQSKNDCYQIAQTNTQSATVKKPDGKPCTPDEKAQKENDNRRDYADLVAQRSSALWAKIMGIAALIGMGLSLVGVALVWTTFRETRKANDIASEANRPWLDVKINLHGIAKAEKALSFRMELIVENIGATPANHLRYAVDGFFMHDLSLGPPFDFEKSKQERKRAIDAASKRANAVIDAATIDGLTVFPKAIEPVFLEEHIAASDVDADANLVAWFVVRLKYSLGHRDGNTMRVFIVKSFGLPNETGFDSIGVWGHTYTETDARIDAWEEGGYAD